jgi:hypothetical protein
MATEKNIKKGDIVVFKPEWQDKGDENITFRAIEDEMYGSVDVVAELGLAFNPISTVEVRMISKVQ